MLQSRTPMNKQPTSTIVAEVAAASNSSLPNENLQRISSSPGKTTSVDSESGRPSSLPSRKSTISTFHQLFKKSPATSAANVDPKDPSQVLPANPIASNNPRELPPPPETMPRSSRVDLNSNGNVAKSLQQPSVYSNNNKSSTSAVLRKDEPVSSLASSPNKSEALVLTTEASEHDAVRDSYAYTRRPPDILFEALQAGLVVLKHGTLFILLTCACEFVVVVYLSVCTVHRTARLPQEAPSSMQSITDAPLLGQSSSH